MIDQNILFQFLLLTSILFVFAVSQEAGRGFLGTFGR